MFKFVAFFACLALANAVTVTPCPGGLPAPIAVRIDGCEELPCDFVKGTRVAVEAEASTPNVVESMTVRAIADWNGIIIDVPLEESDGCALLVDATCPVPGETVVTVRAEIEVPSVLPEATLQLTVDVLNQDQEIIECFTGEINIVSA